MTDETNQLPAEVKLTPIMQMMETAVERGNIEVVTKLMDLQERAEAAQARREFDAAFAAVKAKVGIIRKTGKANYGLYADLADIARALDPAIAEHGLSYRFRSQRIGNELLMTCVVCHRAGHFEENSLPSPLDMSGSKNPVQAVGSTSTYLQRYTLIQAFGLAASVNGDIHDDDGAGAAVVNGWPRGSIHQEGDYAGGTPEGKTKPKQEPKYSRLMNAAVTHADRARALQDELRQCTSVSELMALGQEIMTRREYKNLPDQLTDYIWKTQAKCLDRLQSEVVHDTDDMEPRPATADDLPAQTISERALDARNGSPPRRRWVIPEETAIDGRPPRLQELNGPYDFPEMPPELERRK